MKSAVIVFPGSNREGDVVRALAQAGSHGRESLARGDRFAVGHRSRRAARRIFTMAITCAAAPSRDARTSWTRCGPMRRAAGWCSASATASRSSCESGLLPGVLMRNANLNSSAIASSCGSSATTPPSPALYAKGQAIEVCIAHGEGNYTADEETLRRLEGEGRVAFRYCDAQRRSRRRRQPQRLDELHRRHLFRKLNVLGMMPHPENLIEALVGGTDGRGLFESLVSTHCR